jgi:DNA-directed RNA polymerase specialized sigma24 family protein
MEGRSDEELMSLVMAGDASALAPLVDRYHTQLLAYAFRLTQCDVQTAEDILQEAFIRVLTQKTFQAVAVPRCHKCCLRSGLAPEGLQWSV